MTDVRTITEEWIDGPRQIKVRQCDCGCEVYCDNGWSNECDCGATYNGAGQQLAPRHMWGEETGETF